MQTKPPTMSNLHHPQLFYITKIRNVISISVPARPGQQPDITKANLKSSIRLTSKASTVKNSDMKENAPLHTKPYHTSPYSLKIAQRWYYSSIRKFPCWKHANSDKLNGSRILLIYKQAGLNLLPQLHDIRSLRIFLNDSAKRKTKARSDMFRTYNNTQHLPKSLLPLEQIEIYISTKAFTNASFIIQRIIAYEKNYK